MGDTKLLLQEASPNGNVEAVVEDDGRATYLYWNPAPQTGLTMRAVWLRNAGPAPADFDTEGMKDGRAPQLPAKLCKFPLGGQPSLRGEDLHVVWTEDGAGLFLLERGELLAAVPFWSDVQFGGFSRDAAGDSPLAATLGPERLAEAQARLQRAEAFWAHWQKAEAWPQVRDPQYAALEAALGKPTGSFSISSEPWPPRALAAFAKDGWTAAVTVGAGLRAQPGVDRDAGALAPKLRRIELGFCADLGLANEELRRMWGFVGTQVDYPWAVLRWLGNGHTLACDVAPGGPDKFPAVVLLTSPADVPNLVLPPIDGEPVNLLWIVPITANERAWARTHGSAALAAKLAAAGVGWVFRDRPEVPLD